MILEVCAWGKVGSHRNNSSTDMQAGISQMHQIVEDKTSS